MSKDRKTVLAIVLAVKRGFVTPEEGMKILEEAEDGHSTEANATVFSMVPESQQEELRADAAELANDNSEATRILDEAGVPETVQKTLLVLGTEREVPREDLAATLMSLAPSRATGQADTPQLKSPQERYQVLREHARGGMGRILIAVDKVVGREVALKELLPMFSGSGSTPGTPISGSATTATTRFLREATVTGQLEHPNIVPVYEIGQRDDGSLYYTMKFVKGRTMASRLRAIRSDVSLDDEEKLLERLKLLDAFVDICNAIAFAHSRGVIHRDIKPANIMLGDFGEALVLDWGLARVRGGEEIALSGEKTAEGISPEITLEGEVMGTPAYMPPEQAAGRLEKVDERSDVYSLGAVLFEIVSGEPPYRGKTAKQVLSSVLSEQPRQVNDISPEAPPELAALVARALSREPEERFRTARELAEQVQAYRDGRMVSAYQYSAVELISRFIKKNRAVVSVVALALILILAGGVYAYTKVKAERDSALAAETDATNQKQLADKQAAEAKRQKAIAEQQAVEARRQEAIADQSAEDAANARDEAKIKAVEAEKQRKLADQSAKDAEAALKQSQNNLAQAHLGYATLAAERDQPNEHIVHLAAAHAADGTVVGVDRVVSTLNQTVFPLWRTRSYVDLPAGASAFSTDCRLCAAPIQTPRQKFAEIVQTTETSDMSDIGIWDVATGTLLRRIVAREEALRRTLLNADGTRLVALDNYGSLVLWDVTTGLELSRRSPYDWVDIPMLVPGPDGKTFFTASPSGQISEWNFADGTPGRRIKGDDLFPEALAVSADSKYVAVSTGMGDVLLWELGTGRPPVRKSFGSGWRLVGFGPDGPLVAYTDTGLISASSDIQLWDTKLEKLLRTFSTRAGEISCVAVNSSGTQLAAGLFKDGWKLYDYGTGKVIQQRGKSGGNVVGLNFSPDGKSLVLAQKGEGFDVVEIGGNSLVKRAPDHSLGSMALEFSPDGRHYASGGLDGRVILRNVTDGSAVWSIDVSTAIIHRLTFSPDGSTIAVYSENQQVSFISVETGELTGTTPLNLYAYSMKFSVDGSCLSAPTREGPLHLIDPATAKIIKTLTLEKSAFVLSLAFAPNTDAIWMVDQNLTMWEWRWKESDTAEHLGQVNLPGTVSVYNTTMSADGQLFVISLGDGRILGLTPRPFAQKFELNVGAGPIHNSSFGTSPGFLVCGTGDGELCFVDVTRSEVVKRQSAHRAAIIAVAVSPDGRSIITSGADGEFKAWEAPTMMYPDVQRVAVYGSYQPCMSSDGRLIALDADSNLVRVIEHKTGDIVDEFPVVESVSDLKFSPDDRELIVVTGEGSLLIRNLESKEIRTLRLFDAAGEIDFDTNGKLLVPGYYYGLQVWDLLTGTQVSTVPDSANYGRVRALPGENLVLLTGWDQEPRILNTASGETIATLERGGYGLAPSSTSPDGRTLAIVRDVGLIGLHGAKDGKHMGFLRVRIQDITWLGYLPDGKRICYLTADGLAGVIDAETGQELLVTWVPFYPVDGMLTPDGTTAVVVGGDGHIQNWHIAPQLQQLQKLAAFKVKDLSALTQVLSGLKLQKLETRSLSRRTGDISWLTEDAQPPAFLAGGLPAWLPQLTGGHFDVARAYLAGLRAERQHRIEAFANDWLERFETYRFELITNDDGSTTRVAVPPRPRDEKGNYIGEPNGLVDYAKFITDERLEHVQERQAETAKYAGLLDEAEQQRKWILAQGYCTILMQFEPDNVDWSLRYGRLQLNIPNTWTSTWALERNVSKASPEQLPELQMLWARQMGRGWSLTELTQRFDIARKAGYKHEDWHFYRAEALEQLGAYEEAIAGSIQGMTECKDQALVQKLSQVRERCLEWISMRNVNADLPKPLVIGVPEGSAAEKAGLRRGDLIISISTGIEMFDVDATDGRLLEYEWKSLLNLAPKSMQTVTMKIRRGGIQIDIEYPRSELDAEISTLKAKLN